MAVALSPKPSDGPLNGQGRTVSISIRMTMSGTVGGLIKIAGRPAIEIPIQHLLPGRNRVVIPLPPGGVPPGADLRLIVRESNANSTFAVYKFG